MVIATLEYLTGSSFRQIRTSSSKLFATSLVLVCMFVYVNATSLFAQQLSEHVAAAPATYAAVPASSATLTPAPDRNSTPVALTPTAPPDQPDQGCTPATYALPGALSLAGKNGLVEVVEPTQTYTIYGVSGPELRSQIQACAPREHNGDAAAEYTAQTGYYMSWQYDYAMQSDGNCVVANARIGLHVAMILPDWQPTPDTDPALIHAWQTFSTNLTTHENGHVDLDRQYARDMLTDLQSFPASPCDTIRESVNGVMQNDVARLNIANDQYDAATNHGATQGAVIPR